MGYGGATSWKEGSPHPAPFRPPILSEQCCYCGLEQQEDFRGGVLLIPSRIREATQAGGPVCILHQRSPIVTPSGRTSLANFSQVPQGTASSLKEGHAVSPKSCTSRMTLLSHQSLWGTCPSQSSSHLKKATLVHPLMPICGTLALNRILQDLILWPIFGQCRAV